MIKKLFVVLFILSGTSLFAQEVLDKIVAIVDQEIILASELDYQVQLYAAQRRIDPNTPKLRETVLNQLIDEKLMYAQANLDSITVSEDDVTRSIDYQVENFIRQYGSREKLEQVYGMTIDKIKRELRDNVKKELMVQKVQDKKFGLIEASRRDIEEFYNRYKDSLGTIPEKVKIAHIYKSPKAGDITKRKSREFAQKLYDSLKAGANFELFVQRYSDDEKSKAVKGDIGSIKRGELYPDLEAALYSLKPGEITAVTESPDGFHILLLVEKKGETARAKQILIKIKMEEDADLATIRFLNELKDSIRRDKGTFSDFAKKYSDDKETAPFGGGLGTFYLDQLDKNLLDMVGRLKVGEISAVKRVTYRDNTYGYHMVLLESRIAAHAPDLEVDQQELKKLADDFKKQQLFKNWVAELRTKIFWEVKE